MDAVAASVRRRQELLAEWYAPASHVWPDIALAPSLELFEADTAVVFDSGVARVVPELYAPAWAVATVDALVNREGVDGFLVAELLEAAVEDVDLARELATAAGGNVAQPDTPAILAVLRRWMRTP